MCIMSKSESTEDFRKVVTLTHCDGPYHYLLASGLGQCEVWPQDQDHAIATLWHMYEVCSFTELN